MSKQKEKEISLNEAPVDGSLGLLALGYRGIMAWREARQKAGIDIIGIRKKEYEERKAIFDKKKEEFEKKKAELKAQREAEGKTNKKGTKK